MDTDRSTLTGARIGFALTGSFCTHARATAQVRALCDAGAQVTCIVSDSVAETNTRFGNASELLDTLARLTGRPVLHTLAEVEPIGPKSLFELLVIAPCTGNTLAKLALGITDSPVTLAYKAHRRNEGPVLIAVSSNDALAANAKNIGLLLNTRGVHFVPFERDDPHGKPASLVAVMEDICPCAARVLKGRSPSIVD